MDGFPQSLRSPATIYTDQPDESHAVCPPTVQGILAARIDRLAPVLQKLRVFPKSERRGGSLSFPRHLNTMCPQQGPLGLLHDTGQASWLRQAFHVGVLARDLTVELGIVHQAGRQVPVLPIDRPRHRIRVEEQR
jgi:hypothetical protein